MDTAFYYVDKDYIDFLKKYEMKYRGFTCVPNTQQKTSLFIYMEQGLQFQWTICPLDKSMFFEYNNVDE